MYDDEDKMEPTILGWHISLCAFCDIVTCKKVAKKFPKFPKFAKPLEVLFGIGIAIAWRLKNTN